jgi:uncharacterized protein (DUF885 family)
MNRPTDSNLSANVFWPTLFPAYQVTIMICIARIWGIAVFLLLACQQMANGQTVAAETLSRLIDEVWQFDLQESPLLATRVGVHQYNDQLGHQAVADHKRRIVAKREFDIRLRKIDRSQLKRPDQINYDVFGRLLRNELDEANYRSHLIPITNRSGFHISFPQLPKQVPLNSVKDYENYIARLHAFERYADEHIGLMRSGIKEGMVLPAVVLEGYQDSIATHIVEDPRRSLLYTPFTKMPAKINRDDQQRLAAAGRQAISSSVVVGYRKFLEFMEQEYVPICRGSIGAAALPNGRDFYRHRVRRFTTLEVTPEQVHQTGLDEVTRIRTEMAEVIEQVEFKGDFAAFLNHLRTDPKFYAKSAEELKKETAYVLKKMDGQLPRLFKTMPRTPYGIREVPAYIAPKTTTAYYQQPTGDGSQAGFYYINTYNLQARPLYGVEALSLHEAVPGHHLQIALQQELTGLPDFRRFAGVTAFVEGWALYSERLGLEVGFYQDPYSNFGRLTYEMWRACRLVVDTGMHFLGWTRQQAIQFMAENTALSLHNIEAEVDRYISWPGQALAYKIGELKIRELRTLAEAELGGQFDVRLFHDAVLGHGAIPLDVLEENIRQFIKENK